MDINARIEAFRLHLPYRDLILRHRFLSFFALTMMIQQVCLTWALSGLPGLVPVMRFEMLGPMISACFMIWLQYGVRRVLQTLLKLLRWKVHPIWYFHALFWLPLAAWLGVVARNWWLGAPLFQFPTYWGVILEIGVLDHLSALLLAISEEIAWFGYGFGVLYGRFNAFFAALITGFCWGLSYVPMWQAEIWIADGQPLWTVIVAYMAWALICAWIYNSTRSAFLLAFVQVASNLSYSIFLVLPHLTGETLTVELVTVALLLMGLIVVLIHGPRHMTKAENTWKGEWDRETPVPESTVERSKLGDAVSG